MILGSILGLSVSENKPPCNVVPFWIIYFFVRSKKTIPSPKEERHWSVQVDILEPDRFRAYWGPSCSALISAFLLMSSADQILQFVTSGVGSQRPFSAAGVGISKKRIAQKNQHKKS